MLAFGPCCGGRVLALTHRFGLKSRLHYFGTVFGWGCEVVSGELLMRSLISADSHRFSRLGSGLGSVSLWFSSFAAAISGWISSEFASAGRGAAGGSGSFRNFSFRSFNSVFTAL